MGQESFWLFLTAVLTWWWSAPTSVALRLPPAPQPLARRVSTPRTQHCSSSFPQVLTREAQGRQSSGRNNSWWREVESNSTSPELLKCGAPNDEPQWVRWTCPRRFFWLEVLQQAILSYWMYRRDGAEPPLEHPSAQAHLLEKTQPPRPTSSMGSHSPDLHRLHLLRPSGQATLEKPWRNQSGCMENPCVANNDGHWERRRLLLPALPALIWGTRIRSQRGRAKGDIWLLEPLAPISTCQVKILASS